MHAVIYSYNIYARLAIARYKIQAKRAPHLQMLSASSQMLSPLRLGVGVWARGQRGVAVCTGAIGTKWRSKSTEAPNLPNKEITVSGHMTVGQLAKELKTSPARVARILRKDGQRIKGYETVLRLQQSESVVMAMGHTPKCSDIDVVDVPRQVRQPSDLISRPPVVTVMGHVDHGKTTLLDALRDTTVAASEAGGITQHIGAFSVRLRSGHEITFLDTPGHAAFSAMRARGANTTDIVVLVVAADDSVMEQTKESIRMIQEAGVPMVVAINKCDKHGVDPGRVKHDLLRHGIQLEDFGGEVQAVQVSALKGTGLDLLEEAILALAEISEIKADPKGQVEGVVIETKVDKGLGPVSTVLVQQGTLTSGDVLVAGETWGKMRILLDENRKPVKRASPSTPVLTVGWKELPAAGDEFIQADSEQLAREVVSSRLSSSRTKLERNKLRQIHLSSEEGGQKEVVPLVVKGDVVGSVEVLEEVLASRQPEQLELKVVYTGVGGVTESDVDMAASAQGYILTFNVSVNKTVAALAKKKSVTIISHNVIYKLLDMLKLELESRLPPVMEEELVGEAVILKVFKLTGSRRASVGGCRVKQGRLVKNALYRLVRDGETIHEGPLSGLKNEKDDIDVARKETECGVSFNTDPGFQEGDRVVCFNKKRETAKLDWNLGF